MGKRGDRSEDRLGEERRNRDKMRMRRGRGMEDRSEEDEGMGRTEEEYRKGEEQKIDRKRTEEEKSIV